MAEAPEKPATPEKQLLDLIEKPATEAKTSLRSAAIKYQGMSLFSFGAFKGRFLFFKNRFGDLKGLGSLDIRALNAILELGVFSLAVYLGITLTASIVNMSKELNLKMTLEKPLETEQKKVVSSLRALSYYLERPRQRDLFHRGAGGPQYEAPVKGPSAAIIEATKHLKLVGVSWSADPDVMIEDTKSQKTLFLKKGQFIDNNLKVQGVYKEKVVLSYRGEEIDLR